MIRLRKMLTLPIMFIVYEDAPNIEPIFNIVYYRLPFIGIDLGTMLSAAFAAAAVRIRFFLLQFNKK